VCDTGLFFSDRCNVRGARSFPHSQTVDKPHKFRESGRERDKKRGRDAIFLFR